MGFLEHSKRLFISPINVWHIKNVGKHIKYREKKCRNQNTLKDEFCFCFSRCRAIGHDIVTCSFLKEKNSENCNKYYTTFDFSTIGLWHFLNIFSLLPELQLLKISKLYATNIQFHVEFNYFIFGECQKLH